MKNSPTQFLIAVSLSIAIFWSSQGLAWKWLFGPNKLTRRQTLVGMAVGGVTYACARELLPWVYREVTGPSDWEQLRKTSPALHEALELFEDTEPEDMKAGYVTQLFDEIAITLVLYRTHSSHLTYAEYERLTKSDLVLRTIIEKLEDCRSYVNEKQSASKEGYRQSAAMIFAEAARLPNTLINFAGTLILQALRIQIKHRYDSGELRRFYRHHPMNIAMALNWIQSKGAQFSPSLAQMFRIELQRLAHLDSMFTQSLLRSRLPKATIQKIQELLSNQLPLLESTGE